MTTFSNTLHVAPTEPPELRAIATKVSMMSERVGCDVAWLSRLGTVGIQRKVVPEDLLASMADGRLRIQTQQAQRLAIRIIILEGRLRWTRDGELLHDGPRWSRQQHEAYLFSLRHAGWWVIETCDLDGTIEMVRWLVAWSNKVSHSSLIGRAGRPQADSWGNVSSRAFQIHFLTSLPGVGPELAGRIIDKFGSMPIGWTVSEEELKTVHGLGNKKAAKIWRALMDEEK